MSFHRLQLLGFFSLVEKDADQEKKANGEKVIEVIG